MSSTEAPFSLTIKVGTNNDLLTGRASTAEEMAQRIQELRFLKELITGTTVVAEPTVEEAVANVQAVIPATVVEQPNAGVALSSTAAEVVTDKYGAQYTYGLAEAPQLPDGRGTYVKKAWTSQKGKRLVAWVDPIKGPKPFPKGAVEAELIWI